MHKSAKNTFPQFKWKTLLTYIFKHIKAVDIFFKILIHFLWNILSK